jgi:hypothetical protein
MIADSGLDYGSAKRKAAQDVWGNTRANARMPRDCLPNNDDVDLALLEHLELFDEEHQPRIRMMREVALEVMDLLAGFQSYLTGAAWKGICAEHAHVHLQVFHDNPKEVEYALLNKNLYYEAETTAHWRGDRDVEALAMLYPWQNGKTKEQVPVLISLYDQDELRGALKVRLNLPHLQTARGDRAAVQALLAQSDRKPD